MYLQIQDYKIFKHKGLEDTLRLVQYFQLGSPFIASEKSITINI